MNGSARGTALVVLLAGVPVLACSMLLAARGSAAAVITWLGAAGFLLYNSLMFVFATPANRLFPLYLAMLALCRGPVVRARGRPGIAGGLRRARAGPGHHHGGRVLRHGRRWPDHLHLTPTFRVGPSGRRRGGRAGGAGK